MKKNQTRFLCFMLFLTHIVSGCALKDYRVRELESDKEFIIAEVLATGLIIGGVDSNIPSVLSEDKITYRNLLAIKMLQSPVFGNFAGLNLVVVLGQEKYSALMEHYHQYNKVPEDIGDELQTVLYPTRYILFVNIDKDKVKEQHFREDGRDVFRTTRQVRVSAAIHNLRTGAVALRTVIEADKYNENRHPKHTHEKQSFLGSVIGAVVEDLIFGGYPDPPSITETLSVAFEGVTDQLPDH